MVMIEWKSKSKISIINLNKKLNKSKKSNKKIESKLKIFKGGFLIQKWSGNRSSEILSTEKISKFKPLKIPTNNKSKNIKNWENFKVNLSKNKRMILFIPIKKSSKNCQKSYRAKKEQYNLLLEIIEKKNQRIFH